MINSKFCAAAFNTVGIDLVKGGYFRGCCLPEGHILDNAKYQLPTDDSLINWANNKDQVELRADILSNRWHPTCRLCKINEEHRVISLRQRFSFWEIPEENSILRDLMGITRLNIFLDNKCNNSCVMCGSDSSSMWAKEQEKINNIKIQYSQTNRVSLKQTTDLIDQLPNLKTMLFVGGEPIINKDHYEILKYVISQGRAKNMVLSYVTNLSTIPPELIKLCNNFEHTNLAVSVDGIGSVNEYIRYPFTWETIIKRLDTLKHIAEENNGKYSFMLSHTISTLNLLSIDKTMTWWEDQILHNSYIQTELPHMNCVIYPHTLNPIYMPSTMKDEARERLGRLATVALNRGLESKYFPIINLLSSQVLDVTIEETERRKVWLEMQDYLTKLDKHRGRKIVDYLPFMEKYWLPN